jgi:hypothetical protein
MSHLLLSTLIASSLYARLPSSFTLLFLMVMLVLSTTPRTTLELSTTSLPLSPTTSSSAADGDRRAGNTMAVASPSTHNTLAVHAQLRLQRRGKEICVVRYPKLYVFRQFQFFVSGLAAQVVVAELGERGW